MSFLTIIIASAGMTLATGSALAAPESSSCALCAAHAKAAETAAPKCAACAARTDGKKCAKCAAHADAGSDMDKDLDKDMDKGHDAKACEACESLGEGKMCAACAAQHAMDADKELPMIDAALYASADWPTHNSGEALYAKDYQGKKLPVGFGNETWISEKTNLEGKVLVLDFWATWCGPCVAAMPMLNELQVDNDENLAVVAIGGQREDEDTVRSFVENHKESINNLYDAKQSVFMPFRSKFIPLVVVVSTDGVVRWIGNPGDPAFKKAVKKVIAVDPMIQAKS